MRQTETQRDRRVRQIEHYLGLMEHRCVQLVKASCFVIFSHPMPAGLRQRLSSNTRFVQFAFSANGFFLDLPDTTLTPEEAQRLVQERPGFVYALERTDPAPKDGDRQFDPLQKQYEYGQQTLAAADAAYIFFDLWQLPLDAWIQVAAEAFEGKPRWERNFSLA